MHLSLPLAFKATFDDQEQVVNGATDAQDVRHLEHAGHPQPRSHALAGVLAQRGHIMRNNCAFLFCSPLEDGRIVGS
jgi:hypothetical protein